MSKCVVCGKECTGQCCSGACRAKKSRTPEAHAPGRTVKAHAPRTIIDACSVEHPIDFEDRRRVQTLLDGWAEGKGTPYQQILGKLAHTYTLLKLRPGEELAEQQSRYLGTA